MSQVYEDLAIPMPVYTEETCPKLADLSGDWFDIYAILVSPELVSLDGTCRDQVKVLRCDDGHLHLPIRLAWQGPIAPIGFVEFWERKANLTGVPIVRLQSDIKDLPTDETLTVGPGILA